MGARKPEEAPAGPGGDKGAGVDLNHILKAELTVSVNGLGVSRTGWRKAPRAWPEHQVSGEGIE